MTITRPVEMSLFPEVVADRPRGPIPGSVQSGSNADLIAIVAPFYLTGSVLDVTYGEGNWWKRFRPTDFTYHDLYKVDGVDFRSLPEADSSIDTVCFDPPYVISGGSETSTVGDFLDRFGIGDRGAGDLYGLMLDGLAECARVARKWLLVKCMEFAQGGVFHDIPTIVTNEAARLGASVHDRIVHHTGSGPGGHNIWTPVRARRHHSYLVVFKAAD